MYRSALGNFTNEKAEAVYIEALRRMTIEQRWQTIAAMRQVVVDTMRAEVRAQYPDWNERRVKIETTWRVLEANGVNLRAIRGFPTSD